MGLTHVTVALRGLNGTQERYEADFLVDTSATDSMAPAAELRKAGIEPVEKMVYELADGTVKEYPFGLAVIEFMGEVTAGRIIFGPDDAEPILGVTALESVGILVDPAKKTLKRLPAIPLKALRRAESRARLESEAPKARRNRAPGFSPG
jgi:clan AA aspartic protease